MKKNTIEDLFNKLEGTFDVHETPEGHQRRFMDRLNQQQQVTEIKVNHSRNWWKPLSIAATIVVILGIGFLMSPQQDDLRDLASVSPELGETESFFTTAISQQIEQLRAFETPETSALVNDALNKVNELDLEYQELRKDLTISGNDKRVIHAMIANLQSRIDLLEQVVVMVEDLNNLKSEKDETII